MATEAAQDGRNLLTHSRMACAKTCLRKHYFAYELGIRREDTGSALRMGSAFHLGLDMMAQGQTLQDAVDAIFANYSTLPSWITDRDAELDWWAEYETVVAMVSLYRWRYKHDGIEILATEQEFEIPLINPETGKPSRTWRLAGKIDKIVRLPDGRTAVMEHKTTSDSIASDSDYWSRLRLDSQISLYVLAARELGYDVQTVLYDVVRKPRHERYRATPPELRKYKKDGTLYASQRERDETPQEFGQRVYQAMYTEFDSYFARQEIPRLESDLDEFRWELWQQAQLIRECQRTNRWYRNTAACLHPFKCEYFTLCSQGINPAENLPDGFVRLEQVNPELQGV